MIAAHEDRQRQPLFYRSASVTLENTVAQSSRPA
jgi:hypothetical protein